MARSVGASARSRPRRAWPGAIAVVVLVSALSGPACSVHIGLAPDKSERLALGGFSDIRGLELVDFHEEGRLDTIVEFVLRGSPADIDRALTRAHFTESFAAR
jgi:hypothetical protein